MNKQSIKRFFSLSGAFLFFALILSGCIYGLLDESGVKAKITYDKVNIGKVLSIEVKLRHAVAFSEFTELTCESGSVVIWGAPFVPKNKDVIVVTKKTIRSSGTTFIDQYVTWQGAPKKIPYT